MGRRVLTLVALPALIAALAGCGSSSSTTTTTVVATASQAGGSGASSANRAPAASEAVATVDRTPITKAAFNHWMSVTAAVSRSSKHGGTASAALKNQVLGFLITSEWVLAEAAHLGLHVSEAEAKQRVEQVRGKQFPKVSELKKYLASIGESEADLLQRAKVELLELKTAQRVTAGKTASTETHALLEAFQSAFYARWKRRTSCAPGYVMEDCKEYKSQPHAQAQGSASAGGSEPASTSTTASPRSAPDEVYSAPGSMTLSSPAFEPNGAIPARYTCDGADVSPPLQWRNVPAHTAELVLFAIDESTQGPQGGIRWVVAGIDPSLTGVKENSLPPGAIVGLNGAGKATYGGFCPAKGKTASIQFILWALSRKITLSNGFTPTIAEQEYSKSELSSAVTYATYTR